MTTAAAREVMAVRRLYFHEAWETMAIAAELRRDAGWVAGIVARLEAEPEGPALKARRATRQRQLAPVRARAAAAAQHAAIRRQIQALEAEARRLAAQCGAGPR
jgi:hypothetical protein